jgi:hypothetical protein
MTNHARIQHFRSMPRLTLAKGCSAFLSRRKEKESLRGPVTVLEDAAKGAGSYVNDSSTQIESTEMTDSGGGR